MKNYFTALFVILGIVSGFSQENKTLDFSGENFSLEGALVMFKKAKTLEEFEKLINEENNNVNNIDLNNDGDIDYVSVEGIIENNNHLIILSALLGKNDKQDIATIAIEKTANEEAQLQIIGDQDLYAENTFAEPFELLEKMDNSGKGPNTPTLNITKIVVNVWLWPSVRFIYAPGYKVWISPHRWGFYPRWWKPWKPFRHTVFISRCHAHKTYIHRTPTRRVAIHKSYAPRRHASTIVVKGKRGTTVVHKGRKNKVKAVRVKGRRR